MSKDYMNRLRRKSTNGGETYAERSLNKLKDTMDELLDNKENPNVHTVIYMPREKVGLQYEGESLNMLIDDVSKNDIKTNDDKYVNVKYEDRFKVGDEIYWHNSWWIFYHEERNSILSHKTFTMKRCNYEYTYVYNGVKYIIPSALISLTLYSDGLSDKVYLSNSDGKRRIYMPDNSITKTIGIGSRMMITNNTVFEFTHVDDFSRPGCRDCILGQVFNVSKDDKENNIAYNKGSEIEDTNEIVGDKEIYLGGNNKYTLRNEDVVGTWSLEDDCGCVSIDTTYGGSGCRLICKNDIDYIGHKLIIKFTSQSSTVYKKEIIIKGLF